MANSTYANTAAVDAALDKAGTAVQPATLAGYSVAIGTPDALTALDDADYIPVLDTSATAQKKTLWSNIKSVLKTYFDTLYPALAHKTRHATGGADALSAADIGAQASVGAASGILKADGSGTISAATAGTDYLVDIVSDTTPQLGGELDQNGKSIGGTETDNGNSGTSKTIDWRNGNHQKVTMTGNCTFTFTAPTKCGMLSLRLIQDGTGSRTITLPTMKKVGGTAFTFSTAANAIDILSIYYDGSAYYGQAGIAFS